MGIQLGPPPSLDFYVEPDLSSDLNAPLGKPFCLISAPAAVGKTTLARELQRALVRHVAVLYVPLKEAVIGQNYFSGLLQNAFKQTGRQDILRELFTGRIVLIFDGYDEISMTADQVQLNKLFTAELRRAYDEYLEDGGELSNGPCVVFLYRSVFGRLGIFDDILSSSGQLSVDFFTPPQRRAYLTEYLAAQEKLAAKSELATRNKKPVPPALAAEFLEGLEQTLEVANAAAPAFFGHAIVLSAFGDYLEEEDETNAKRLANDLRSTRGREGRCTELLSRIVDDIVSREVGKFPDGAWSGLVGFTPYPQDLQRALLCEAARQLAMDPKASLSEPIGHLGRRLASDLLAQCVAFQDLAADEQSRVETSLGEELQKKIEHHPFLDVAPGGAWSFRNPIYHEYYLAKHWCATIAQSAAPILRKHHFSAYLAYFLLSEQKRIFSSGFASDMLFYLVSLFSARTRDSEIELFLEIAGNGADWHVTVESDDVDVEPFVLQDELLVLGIPNGEVLKNLAVIAEFHHCYAPRMLVISGPPGHDERSSTVTVRAATIAVANVEFDAARVNLEDVHLDVLTLTFSERVERIDGIDRVTVCGGDHKFDLEMSEYIGERYGDGIRSRREMQTEDLAGLTQKLGRVFLWFRKHRRPQYAIYNKRFETVVTRRGRDAEMTRFAAFLFDKRVLLREGELIVLDQDTLGSFGVHYLQQNQLECDPTRAAGLLAEWIAWP